MDMTSLLFILIGISIPVALYLWRDKQYHNPASRWPQLAKMLEFQYAADPPSLEGEWKGRRLQIQAHGESAYLLAELENKGPVRVEIGPKAEVEKAAGIVVPDRVTFAQRQPAFDDNFTARATPLELGYDIDYALRQKIAGIGDVYLLAQGGRLQMRVPVFTEAAPVREAMDVCVSLADAIDRK